jgi:hypothetical protein
VGVPQVGKLQEQITQLLVRRLLVTDVGGSAHPCSAQVAVLTLEMTPMHQVNQQDTVLSSQINGRYLYQMALLLPYDIRHTADGTVR